MKHKPMTLYLSGPMTGIPEYNAPAFHVAAQILRAEGHTVISPAEMDAEEGHVSGEAEGWVGPEEEYERLLKRDFEIIEDVDAIVFLPGWENSGGAGREGEVALKLGKALYVYYPSGARQWGSSLLPLNVQRFKSLHTKKRVTRDATPAA